MNQCDEIRAQMTFHLDDELQGNERAALETHLRGCEACRRLFEGEQRFLEVIRASQPLHVAPLELRARVEQVLADTPSPHAASKRLRHRIRWSLWPGATTASGLIHSRRVAALAAVAAVALLIGIWGVTEYRKQRPNPPSDFALMAVDTHQRHLRSQLPLEIASAVPERISAWFAGKVPFSVKLPNYQESSGQEKLYDLEGARLVGYKNDYAAYVAYKMRLRPISLVVTSEAVARPSGGEEIVSKGLTFHFDSIQGLKVITWSDRGLTYALVSDLEERGQQSCIVCHQGTRDQDFIESLKPKQVSDGSLR
ncbi:MAG: zf-HC2 domain-containing protein [Acidobacteriota bacterium]